MILDQGKVIKFVCENSGRAFYRIKEPTNVAPGAKSEVVQYYDVLNDFCFCNFTARECLSEKGSSIMCKHVLAAKLAEAMEEQGLMETKLIEDNDFAPLYLSSKCHQ